MMISDSPDEARFRRQLRQWLASNPPPSDDASFEQRREYDKALSAHGYLAPEWPSQFGGSDATPALALVLEDELAQHGWDVSRSPSRFGTRILGPTLIVHGTPPLQKEHLSAILSVERIWCQGFSEPDAGSDLAAVNTHAQPHGDGFRLTGTKIWTTQARQADFCFVLARTDPHAPRYRNLSLFLVPMDRPGIQITPIPRPVNTEEFCEVRFDEVPVRRDEVVGEVGAGWKVAMSALSSERSHGLISRYRQSLRLLGRIAGLLVDSGVPRTDSLYGRFATLQARTEAIRCFALRLASDDAHGNSADFTPSIAKLWWSETLQQICGLGMDVSAWACEDEPFWVDEYFASRPYTIFAGTSQVQRNIIAERILGLPR